MATETQGSLSPRSDIIAGFGGDQLIPAPSLTFEVSLMYSFVIWASGNSYC